MRSKKTHTTEEATRFGVKANAYLGASQLVVGILSGNAGFLVESAHQASDSAALQAKANAMKPECSPRKAGRLRRLAALALVAGGIAGIGGGVEHFVNDSHESDAPIELAAALAGAAVNTAIVRRAHGSSHDHGDHHHHQEGAAKDAMLHVATDMGTGWLYTASLALEHKVPGITNYTLILNGSVLSGVGLSTMRRISQTPSD